MLFGLLEGPLSDLRQFLTTENPLTMMKNAFYFMLKAFFALKIFTFFGLIFWSCRNGLMKKLRLISKFMTSQAGQKTITIHILPNLPRSKSNHQAMKFGQLVEYNIRYIFLQKSCKKWCRETNPRPLSVSEKSFI